jgi:hypothetical protein
MRVPSRLSATGLVMALVTGWLIGTAAPASAQDVASERKPVAVSRITLPTSTTGDVGVQYGCDVYTFGPSLGAVGVYVEWDIYCDFYAPFLSVGGVLRTAGLVVGSNSANCSGNWFCVLVVQSSGCVSGRLYDGRMDGAIQFPNGQTSSFTFLAPPNGVPVRVC